MSDMTDYKDLLGRYMTASVDFIESISDEVIEESEEASDALAEMAQIAVEALLLRVRGE